MDNRRKHTKRVFAMLLAFIMCLSQAVTAAADEVSANETVSEESTPRKKLFLKRQHRRSRKKPFQVKHYRENRRKLRERENLYQETSNTRSAKMEVK